VNTTPDFVDGRSLRGAAIGVVPVCHDDPQAPAGCAALRELRGSTLLIRSVAALLGSGVVGELVVTVPPVLVPLVEELLRGAALPAPGASAVRVHAVRENGFGHRARAGLRLAVPTEDPTGDPTVGRPVVVHDPLFPLAPAGLVRDVVEALTAQDVGDDAEADGRERCVVAVPVRPVTDTLKWVDEDGMVLGTADRDGFLMVSSPQAYWPAGLASTLDKAGDELLGSVGADVLPRLIQASGGHLLPVTAPGEVFRTSTTEDLILADAMLVVGAGGSGQRDEPPPSAG
jgi:2-C-methyl-D-erythritol 4-phosphate cytidylyltransferase